MTQYREPTRLLVAVAATIPQGLILAVAGENARTEIHEMSCNPDEWAELGDTLPKEPGFYVWEGEFVGEDGAGMGEYGGRGDPDYEWQGEWRTAGVRDLLTFNFFHSSAVCPRHDTPKRRSTGNGHLYCHECFSEMGQKAGVTCAANWRERNAERTRLVRKQLAGEISVAESVRLGELNDEANRLVGRGKARGDLDGLLEYLRRGRLYLPLLAPEQLQCSACWATLTRADVVAAGNLCSECGHKFTEREFGHGGACCTACYPYPHHFVGADDGLLTCAHCPARAKESALEFTPLGVMTWVDLSGVGHTFDPTASAAPWSCRECGVFLYPDGRDAHGHSHPQVHRDGNQHVAHNIAPSRKEPK